MIISYLISAYFPYPLLNSIWKEFILSLLHSHPKSQNTYVLTNIIDTIISPTACGFYCDFLSTGKTL